MKHGSLFSGIGGFDLASQWMGWENKFHCEWNEFGQKILNYYWPNAESYGDITKTDFTIWNGKIDILTGGFPCQPYSQAGKRRGKEDERHLWPEMLRSIKEIEPRWIVGENVYGIVNWNGGMVFEEVQAQLEDEGYEVQPYILPAAGVNAPHQRYRIWFVAHSNSIRNDSMQRAEGSNNEGQFSENKEQPGSGWASQTERHGKSGITSDTQNKRQKLSWKARARRTGFKNGDRRINNWRNFPTQSPVCSRNDGLSPELDGITFPKWRNESIKGYGNAIVPQVALQIFKAIEKYETRLSHIQPRYKRQQLRKGQQRGSCGMVGWKTNDIP